MYSTGYIVIGKFTTKLQAENCCIFEVEWDVMFFLINIFIYLLIYLGSFHSKSWVLKQK